MASIIWTLESERAEIVRAKKMWLLGHLKLMVLTFVKGSYMVNKHKFKLSSSIACICLWSNKY